MSDYPPCLNPACKSHGKPHPNCRCYGSFAEGGEVENYCASHRVHNDNCKYYSEGGVINPPGMDPSLAASAFLSGSGLHGLIKLGTEAPDESLLRYNQAVKRGHKNIDSKIGGLFGEEKADKEDYTKARKSIHEWLDKGGATTDLQEEMHKQNDQQMFAGGGEVRTKGLAHDHHVATAYPDQNLLLQTAKGRLSNYLGSLKPQKNQPKLVFDDEPDQTEKQKSYERAVKMAADPMRILKKVKEGTILPEHVEHFKNMYPEMAGVLDKKLNAKIAEAQLKGEKPSYKVRQGLSLLLGTPLSGEMTPQNMMAAQAVFQSKQQPPPPQSKTAVLKTADDSYLTSNQARASREQRQK